jgi:hypothetical protein
VALNEGLWLDADALVGAQLEVPALTLPSTEGPMERKRSTDPTFRVVAFHA